MRKYWNESILRYIIVGKDELIIFIEAMAKNGPENGYNDCTRNPKSIHDELTVHIIRIIHIHVNFICISFSDEQKNKVR